MRNIAAAEDDAEGQRQIVIIIIICHRNYLSGKTKIQPQTMGAKNDDNSKFALKEHEIHPLVLLSQAPGHVQNITSFSLNQPRHCAV
jgi:hypothetical protein